jgi:hypothetical protein
MLYKLQLCDVAVFEPLKTAYQELAEGLDHSDAKTISKQHFTLFYDQARRTTLTPENIESGWAKTGLYLFNLDRVLQDMQKPPALEPQSSHTVDTALYEEPLQTPVSSEHLMSLRKTIE